MSGSTFPTGISTRKTFSGSTAATDNSRLAATTKFISKTAVIRCDAQTSETETAFTLPTNAIVKDVYLNVITVDATETVDVGTTGTSNDPNGYLSLASLATAGLVSAVTVVTVGSNETFIASTTKGALLANVIVGTDLNLDTGNYIPITDISAGGDTISYTCSAGSDTAVFDIVVEYVEVVSEIN
jgi:hypothetical protein